MSPLSPSLSCLNGVSLCNIRTYGKPQNVAKNQKSRAGLLECINDAGAQNGCSRGQGNLLYTISTKFPANALVHRKLLLDLVMSDKVNTMAQVDAAHEFLAKVGADAVSQKDLEEAAGVGVTISADEVRTSPSISWLESSYIH